MKEINNTNLLDIRDRVKKAIAILKGKQIIEKQKDIADSGIIKDTNLSKALKPDIRYLTLSFLEKFCSQYELINLNWLLTGEGTETNELCSKVQEDEKSNFQKLSTEDKLNFLYEQNEQLKDLIETLSLSTEISLAPILRHFQLRKDEGGDDSAAKSKSSIN